MCYPHVVRATIDICDWINHHTRKSSGSSAGSTWCNSSVNDDPKFKPSFVAYHSPLSYSNRFGPDRGLDHHSCRFGVCLLITHVPWGGNVKVKTPEANTTSDDDDDCSQNSSRASWIVSSVESATGWYSRSDSKHRRTTRCALAGCSRCDTNRAPRSITRAVVCFFVSVDATSDDTTTFGVPEKSNSS